MQILHSDWLISMLEKSSKTPIGRMLNLFDILEDWLNAPTIAEQVKAEFLAKKRANNTNQLQQFLALQAAKAGAVMPEMLASQLYFMAIAAAQEKLLGQNQTSLQYAKIAANALIAAQTKKDFHIKRSTVYGLAASFLGILVISSSLVNQNLTRSVSAILKPPHVAQNQAAKPVIQQAKADLFASPEQTTALFNQIEQMRKGDCQLIEAIQLPDSYKRVYFENIVMGQISTNVNDQKLVRELLQKVRCNYTPMLMANSK
jgi:hypothetical protein